MSEKISDNAMDQRARKAAKRAGFVARKSRWRRDSVDNRGEYMLMDPQCNRVVGGEHFDMAASEVIEFCRTHRAA